MQITASEGKQVLVCHRNLDDDNYDGSLHVEY